MYLSELKLWNFRKFGSGKPIIENGNVRKPDLCVPFQKGLNLLVGENDSGKTAIIDAIRIILGTNNLYERNGLEIDDFYTFRNEEKTEIVEKLRIECLFYFKSDNEAKNFLEWSHFEDYIINNEKKTKYVLKLFLEATQKEKRKVSPYEIKGGIDDDGTPLNAEARELLKATYLKPLRDANNELQPKKGSRLSQILLSHKFSEEKKDTHGNIVPHPLIGIVKEANNKVKNFFIDDEPLKKPYFPEKEAATSIHKQLNKSLNNFFGKTAEANFDVSETTLKGVLEKLMLGYEEIGKGLGSQNLLFIAAELLLLERDNDFTGLRLALIEEIEAHLHPQAQMRLVEYLQKECEGNTQENKLSVQMLLTTHSPNLASKVKLENLIICQDKYAYPMGSKYTMLEKGDYAFLERFLDVTKANLFFAKGVILVEGDAENLLLPTIAKIIDCDLTQNGVSIVNLGGLTFKYYERIFIQKDKPQSEQMNIPVAVVTDVDTKVWAYYSDTDNEKNLEDCYELNQIIIDEVNTQYSSYFDNLVFDTNKCVFDNFEEGILVYFRSYLKEGKKRLPNKFKEFLESKIIKRKITQEELSNNQTQVKALKEQQYSPTENAQIKGFVNTHWTLEYELALSCLKDQFYTAILMAKDTGYFVTQELANYKQEANTQISTWKSSGKTSEQIAYEIYWVEMMGKGTNKTSKAIVAQFFAEILEIEMNTQKTELKRQIESDEHIKYLVEAIKHATKTP